MTYSNRYYGHKESRNENVEDSEEFIRGSPDIKRDARLQGDADWMSYSNTYYSHRKGRNDKDDTDVCITGSPDATPQRQMSSWIN